MILAGDIGGTKTNLALYELENDELKVIAQKQFASKDYDTFMELVVAFQKEASMPKIDALCIGIAGPIINERCRTTNLPWDIKALDLKEHFGIDNVRLLNDLESTAYGMLYLKDEEFIDLNPTGRKAKGNIHSYYNGQNKE